VSGGITCGILFSVNEVKHWHDKHLEVVKVLDDNILDNKLFVKLVHLKQLISCSTIG
jgi:hypothetical protein